MKSVLSKLVIFTLLIMVIFSCKDKEKQVVEGEWIKGNQAQQLEKIEWQFRGFDKAMVETDYRYQALYFAGKDANWEYADYLNKKIRKAIETGLQRRPKRAKSAEHFLNTTLPDMQKAIETQDPLVFDKAITTMTTDCNACHALEKLPFFTVKIPLNRHSSIRK